MDFDIKSVYNDDIPLISSKNADNIAKTLYRSIVSGSPVFCYGDVDTDGFCCSKVWQTVLGDYVKVIPFKHFKRTHRLNHDIVSQASSTPAQCVLICDTGSSLEDVSVINMLRANNLIPIVIDHHIFYGDYDNVPYLYFNSVNEIHSEISGAYACLLVANVLCTKYLKKKLPFSSMLYALASMYSDCVDMSTDEGMALYNCVSAYDAPLTGIFSAFNKNYALGKRLFTFAVSPRINSCFRLDRFDVINSLLETENQFVLNELAEVCKEIHSESKALVQDIAMGEHYTVENFGEINLYIINDFRNNLIVNFTGQLANTFASRDKCTALVLVKNGYSYQGSYRSWSNRPMLDEFRVFCEAGGHPNAFGFVVRELSEFKKFLKLLKYDDSIEELGYKLISSEIVNSREEYLALVLYNEYCNIQKEIHVVHKIRNIFTKSTGKYYNIYDFGLGLDVTSYRPLHSGEEVIMVPCITRKAGLIVV